VTEKEEARKARDKNGTGAHTQILVRLSNELLERIEAFARADHRSRTNAIEYLLWQAVKKEERT
jgi:hypothetical protein